MADMAFPKPITFRKGRWMTVMRRQNELILGCALPCSTGQIEKNASSAVATICRNLTGQNTVRNVLNRSGGVRPVTEYADIGLICNALGTKKALICKAFRVLVNRGADTFPIQHPGRPSEGPQKALNGATRPGGEALSQTT